MKQFVWSMVATVCVAATLSAGCKNASCQSYCEHAQARGCGSSACISQCEAGRINSQSVGCTDAYQHALNCVEENPCTSNEACISQREEYASCATTFCTNNPGNSLCATP